MSRVAKKPVDLPKGVTATVADGTVTVKGAKGALSFTLAPGISISQVSDTLTVQSETAERVMVAGSTRAHLANMVHGVSAGFERKLELVGVGYRASVQGKALTRSFTRCQRASRSRRRHKRKLLLRVPTASVWGR